MRRFNKLLWLTGMLCAGLFAMGTGAAQAQTGGQEISVIFEPGMSAGSVYTYRVELAGPEIIIPDDGVADFFTTYDIFCDVPSQAEAEARFSSADFVDPDWEMIAEAVSPPFPAVLVVPDDPLRGNLRFVYTGDETLGPGLDPVVLGFFTVDVPGAEGGVEARSQTSITRGEGETGPLEGPGGEDLPAITSRTYQAPLCVSPIPEPGALALLLPGLLPLGVLVRRRRSS